MERVLRETMREVRSEAEMAREDGERVAQQEREDGAWDAGAEAARRYFAYDGSVPFGPVGYGWHDRDRRARIAFAVAVGDL